MAQHDNYVIKKDTLTGIAGEVKALAGVSGDITLEQMKNNISQANTDVSTQADIIAQIQTALEGKAAGNGSEIIAEIASLIDQSGVLGTTDGSVEDKVEQLIDLAKWKDQIQQSLYANNGRSNDYITVFRNTSVKDVSMFDFSQRLSLQIAFSYCSELENLEIDASSVENIQNMCAECKKLKSVKFTKGTPKLENPINAFRNCTALERVETMDFSKCHSLGAGTNNHLFSGCTSLKEFRVVAESVKVSFNATFPLLSADSINYIFGGLNSEVTGQTLMLSQKAVKKAYETTEGANDGDTSAEWLALKDTKPNWTITLS